MNRCSHNALGGFCWPWDKELECYDVQEASQQLRDAAAKAVAAQTLPGPCGEKLSDLIGAAVNADDWSVLPGGDYQWLNRLWRSLIHNDRSAPPECLFGPPAKEGEPVGVFHPEQTWTPPPDDPTPTDSNFPWGWVIAGVGVCGLAALYWFVWRNKKKRKR